MKLSVIIATHARADSLARLLASLAPQVRDNHELFIAENGSSHPIALPNSPMAVHLHEVRAGKCRIQNEAIRRATGEILIFLDDDLVVAPAYLEEVDRFFAEYPEFAAMKGRILPAEDPRKVAGPQWMYLDLPLVDEGESVTEVRGVLGANMAFRSEAIRAVGMFDERLGPGAAGHEEETEISARLRRHGYRIGYAPNAIVYHEVDRARANRERFIAVARERGFCRTLHEQHSVTEVVTKIAIARGRLAVARVVGATPERIAREERRLAIARGMWDGLRSARRDSRAGGVNPEKKLPQ